MTQRILTIDPSTTALGWAMGGDCGTLRVGGLRPVRLAAMLNALSTLLADTAPEVVVYYRPFARGDDATRCGWGIAGIIEALATAAGAAVLDFPEATVRSFFGKPKGAPRAVLKQWALDTAIELGYKPQTDDEADACLLLQYVERKIS